MKKAKLFFTTLVALMIATVAFAQNVKITGTITDASNGEPVPGATIQLVGSDTNYGYSDALGNYSLSVPKDGVLSVSCLGYLSQEVSVAGRAVVNVALEPEAESLEETIVVAYGTTKKSSFTGSATQLGSESIKKMQTTNVSKALEGAVAGLQIASSSGTPGSGASIHIRGFGSVLAETNPLIVVDGVPYEGSLNSIPSNDIEAITVLKDAAANSMYGARGSNGVIIITTKGGKAGKVAVSFDAKVGVNSRAIPDYDVVTSNADYYELVWESLRNSVYYDPNPATRLGYAQAGLYASGAMVPEFHLYNIYAGVADNQIVDPTTGKINANASALKWNDTWRDVFTNGIRQEYNVTASGGSDKTQGYLSIAYLDDKGIIENSGFTRISVRGKVDHAIGKFIKTGLNISYANTSMDQYNDSEGSNYSNVSWMSQAMPPIYPLYLHDINTGEQIYGANGEVLFDWGDTTGRQVSSSGNAFGQSQTSIYNITRDNLSSRGYLNFNITKNLVLSANVAYDVFNSREIAYMTPVGGDAASVGGRGEQTVDRYTALNANQLLTWTPYFGDHALNILLGHEIKTDDSYELYGHMTSFVNEKEPDFANAVVYQDLQSATSQYFLEGFFSRAEYNYANKYYLTASLRRDGSSRFSEKNRWGNFWAVSGAWNLAGEEFAKNNLPWMNAFKVRASFGTQGNDNIGYTRVYEDLYRIDRVDGAAALVKTFRKAPDVTWEKSDNFNVGFESRLFNRLDLNVEYYVKTTKDMIYSMPLAPSQGSPSSQLVNDMDMENRGVEFDAVLTLVKTKNLLWNINVNGTHYKNTITKVPSDYPEGGKQIGNWWREEGSPLYQYYLYDWRGVDPETGLPQYFCGVDASGNDIIENKTDNAEYIKTGKTPIPDLYGGFGTSLRWGNFDASASFAYQLGGWTLDSNYQGLMDNGDFQTNFHKDMYRRWTPGNTDTDVPRISFGDKYSNSTSTRFLIKSSYLSLRNVTLGYTLPSSLVQKAGIEGVRVYFTGDNLYYISARKGLDVRKSFTGAAGWTYSALRTLSLGVNVTF